MWRPGAVKKFLRTYLLERSLWKLPKDGSVLDLCCGYGFYFTINPRASGIDGDPHAVELLRAKGLDVRHGNVLDELPWEDGRFRWVVAHDVLEHFTFDELERLLREVTRVLAPGGRFLVIVPNRKGFDYGVQKGVGHKLFVTAREVEALAKAAAFEVEAAYPEPLPRTIGRFFTHNKEVFHLRKIR
jgi:SAM-dependent methyltransferase